VACVSAGPPPPATGEVCGGRVLVPLGPREDTHEVQMRFEA
jgi:hypothetical protein